MGGPAGSQAAAAVASVDEAGWGRQGASEREEHEEEEALRWEGKGHPTLRQTL